jgi:GR25 family glycosyltransferase involved in LPS biosynthesis
MILKKKKFINKKIHIEFFIYTILIKSIEFKFNNNIKKFFNIHKDGFLFSIDFDDSIKYNSFEINIFPINNKAKIFIKNIQIIPYNLNSFKKIYWDNIFIINLERRYDRKNDMIKKINKQGILKYQFIDAIDGLDINIINKFNYYKKKYKINIITSGHFACLLSHIKSIEIAKKNGYSSIMILEDDVFFSDNFINIISNIYVPDYDMLYLGGIISKKKIFFNEWSKYNKIMGAYGYILKSNLFDIILNELKNLTEYIDIFYMNFIQKKYKIILLNDLIKTNLNSSDTSNKSLLMSQRLSYIKNIN